MTLFRWSRHNSYILRAFELGYNDFGYVVTPPITPFFVGPRRIFCSLTRVHYLLPSIKIYAALHM